MRHRHLVLEVNENPRSNPIEYILESIQAIYSIHHKSGATRHVNVNIAVATTEEYRMLHKVGIGTYMLFQRTYHREHYGGLHPRGPKSDCTCHTEFMGRAMQGGIDDTSLDVLFSLNTYRYDFVKLMMYAERLETTFGVSPHTISMSRICPADDISLESSPEAVPDDTFLHITTVVRLAVPYTGVIASTHERGVIRQRVPHAGVSQISSGSRTFMEGYAQTIETAHSEQFEVSDPHTPDRVVCWPLQRGYIPSFYTAYYREGRTGGRFMPLYKSGQVSSCYDPNALPTLQEYLEDYVSPTTRELGLEIASQQSPMIPNGRVRAIAQQRLQQIKAGERGFCF